MQHNEAQKQMIALRFAREEARYQRQRKIRNCISGIAWPLGMALGYLSSYLVIFTYEPLWRGVCFFGWAIMLATYLELYAAPQEQSLINAFKKYQSTVKIWLALILLSSPWLSKAINLFLLSTI